jgi:hypothetical protein
MQELAIMETLGLTTADHPWIKDHVTGRARVLRPDGTHWEGESVANNMFNRKFGIEYEIITFRSGRHWHMGHDYFDARQPFVSHVGFRLEDEEPFPALKAPLVQELWTTHHTNEYLIAKRRTYHYQIFDTRPLTGFYSKYIKRVHADG